MASTSSAFAVHALAAALAAAATGVALASACASVAPAPEAGAADAAPDARRHLEHWTPPREGPVKVAFFDADDTLREGNRGRGGPAALLPGRAQALRALVARGFLVAIASNQGGVAAGHVSLAEVDAGFRETVRQIRAGGGDVHWLDFADARDDNRKPNAGMARALERALVDAYGPSFTIDKRASFMVGDDLGGADSGFAKNFGVAFVSAADFFAAAADYYYDDED